MPRETKKKISDTQQSDGSDDNFAATIAQQVQSSWEKKKRESEARFLSTAKAELDRGGRERSREFVKEVDEMQAIMERFVSDYAAIEDKIRALWQQLLHAQDQHVEQGEKARSSVAEMDKMREKGQVRGMAISKKAAEDCNKLVVSLTEST